MVVMSSFVTAVLPTLPDHPTPSPIIAVRSKPLPKITQLVLKAHAATPKPSIHKDIKGTDFSDADQIIYQKIQSKSGAYNNVGTDNAITWGSQQLSLDQGQKVINQLMVLKRAKQTKNTVRETGEWPLGWVDWGYKTPNGKTLLAIHDALPDGVSGAGMTIVEGADDFFLNAGNLDAVSDTSQQKEYVIRAVAEAASQSPPPTWVTDLMQTPLYSPSWRQSYVRPSICVWAILSPGLRCIVIPHPPVASVHSTTTTRSSSFWSFTRRSSQNLLTRRRRGNFQPTSHQKSTYSLHYYCRAKCRAIQNHGATQQRNPRSLLQIRQRHVLAFVSYLWTTSSRVIFLTKSANAQSGK